MKRRRLRIPVKGLEERLRGFRFTQASDLHFTHVNSGVDRLADTINAEEPEAVFLTGDFVSRSHRLDPVLHFVSLLRPRFGVWAVMGNWERNEIGWCLREDVIRRELAAAGAVLLNNEAQPIMGGDTALCVVGVDDALTGRPDLETALSGVPKSTTKILLSHHPSVGLQAARHDIAVTLSGHTHGGQVAIPGVPPVWLLPLERRYLAGLFDLGGSYLYVSRGVGTTGPPFRLWAPNETATFALWPEE